MIKKISSFFLGLILFCAPFALAHANTTTDLVGWWRFDEGAGSTAADSSGNGHTLTENNNPTYVSGKIGPFALNFDGSTQSASHTNLSAFNFGTADFSVSFWMNPSSPWGGATTEGLVGQKSGDSSNGWQIYQDSGHPGHLDMRLGQQNNFITNSTIPTGSWSYITFTRQAGLVSWYVNGVLDATSTNTVNLSDVSSPFYVGYAATWSAYYPGILDDLRIYSRALTAGDVAELYSYTSPGSPKEMTSNDYMITTDSINFAGNYSTSASYSLQDSAGEVGTGNSSSTDYAMNAGYQQMYTSYLSISSLTPVTLSSINGLTGGVATGSLAVTVVTDNPAGYSLSVQASSSPALQTSSGSSFADYSSVSSTSPDYAFTIASSASAFGFSVQSVDAMSQYFNNGSTCNAGSLNTAFACWNGFSTSQQIVAQSAGATTASGTQTTLDLEAGIGSAKVQDAGTYTATITVTAVSL